MEPKIKRKFRTLTFTPKTTEAESTAIRFEDAAGGTVFVGPATGAMTKFDVYASHDADGSFGPLLDSDGNAVSITLTTTTATPTVYSIPDACYGAGAVKFVAADVAATSQTCIVGLKG